MLYLLDSSAVLNDFGFEFDKRHSYAITSNCFNEFKDMRSRHLVENALHNSLLQISEPTASSLQKIRGLALQQGFSRLSPADLSLLALAIDLQKEKQKFVLLSDDYSIQNFCKLLKVPFKGVIHGEIEKTISFSRQCSACGKKFPTNYVEENCDICAGRIAGKRR